MFLAKPSPSCRQMQMAMVVFCSVVTGILMQAEVGSDNERAAKLIAQVGKKLDVACLLQ